MKHLILISSFLLTFNFYYGQFSIQGIVKNQENEALAYANVILENTFIGTFTNYKGEFILKNLKSGQYNLKVSYIGYETFIKTINVDENTPFLEIILKKSPIIANEIIVQATRQEQMSISNVSLLNKQTIQKNNLTQDVPFIISLTPSVVTTSDAGNGVGYTGISIRGSDVRRINVTINDIPLNDAESHGVWWVDLPDIISSTENIQIQRGVGSSTNGAGAFGASINLQTLSLKPEPEAEIHASYGSFNTSKITIQSTTGLINNKFSFDLRLSKIYSDGFIDRAFSDLKSYYFASGYYTSRTMIKFINFSGHEKTYQAWYGVPKDTFQNNPTFNPYTYENQTDNYWQSHYQLHLTHEFNSNIHLHSALHYTKGKGYYESYDEKASFSSYGLPNIIFTNDTIKETDVINQKWLDNDFYGIISSLKIKQKKLHTVIGFSANRYEGLHFGYLIWAQYLPFSIPKYKWYFGTGDKKDINVFIKESYHLSDKIILNGDIQYRYINYKITGKDENLRIVTQEHSYNFINPKGSIQYIINNNQNIVFSFATGRREPTRSDFTDADSGRTPKPELLLDYEFSYRLNNERLLFGFNTYYMDYFNQLVMTGEINSVGTPINTNVNRSFRFGSEIELGIKINDNLKWESNITISRNKIKSFTAYFDDWDNGNQVKKEYKNTDISFSPNSIISSILSYGIKNLEINGIFKYVSSQYLSNIGVEEVKIPSYNTFELLLNYSLKPKFCKALVLQLSVKNIDVKNKAFVTNGWAYSYYYNGKLNHDIAYYPQARNIVLGSMILKF